MKKIHILICCLPILLIVACQPDDDDNGISVRCRENPTDFGCPDYDPCAEIFPASSDFEIIDSVFEFIGDTTLGVPVNASYGTYLYFRPKRIDPRASYAWRVGLDPRVFTEPYVALNWTDFEGTVEVSLDVTVASHSCLDEEELVTTTTTKEVTIIDFSQELPVAGQFRGILRKNGIVEDDNLLITLTGNDLPDIREHWKMKGFPIPGECNRLIERGINYNCGYTWIVNDSGLAFGEAYCSPRNLIVLGQLNPNDLDEFTINYWIDDDNGQRIHRQFVGRRVE